MILAKYASSYLILSQNPNPLSQVGITPFLTSKNHTLPETNSSHLKMDVWNTSFLLGPLPIFRCELLVFRECKSPPTDDAFGS